MLLIRCPYCEEERPELEFRNAGEAHIARSTDMASISDDDFEKFFFIRSNPKGIIFERWRHVHGCARFFNAARDTVTDKFLAVYKAGEPKPDLEKLASSEPAAYANRPPDQLNVKKPRRAPAKKKDA
jgi:sarcosine oxidase subunit delta